MLLVLASHDPRARVSLLFFFFIIILHFANLSSDCELLGQTTADVSTPNLKLFLPPSFPLSGSL